MGESIPGIALLVGVLIVVVLIIVGVVKGGKAKSRRNAINNTIATLIEKRAIKSSGTTGESITRNRDYNPATPLEKEILAKGFENKTTITSKKFHLNLKENLSSVKNAVDKTDVSFLDFDTKPHQRVSSSTHDDSALILPLVIFGSMDPQNQSFRNDNYSDEPGYSIGWGGSSGGDGGGGGGYFGGGDSGGGDGGGGGGGGGD